MSGSLVVQPSFLGDMILTTPMIAWLADHGHGPVDVLATKAAAALLANHPAVRETIVYDKRGTDRGLAGFRRMASALRARRYDAAYHAQGSVRSGALTAAAGIRERVGFGSSAGRLFYTVRVPLFENAHHAARLLSLATREVVTTPRADRLRPRLYPGGAEQGAVDALLGAGEPRPLVALAPGSVWATKRWPYYAELAQRLTEMAGVRIVILGGDADRELAGAIVDAATGTAPGTIVDATGRLSLLASAALVARAGVLVTNDSAPLHLASAMNTPTIAIFGPTVPEFGFGPLADRSTTLGMDALACRPCDRHGPRVCPLGHWRCMREISPEAVARRVLDLLSLAER